MPTRTRYNNRTKPWNAKVQLENKHYHLGWFQTREEAVTVEDEFKQALRDITAEAHHMWRQKAEYLNAVAKVTAPKEAGGYPLCTDPECKIEGIASHTTNYARCKHFSTEPVGG